MTTKRDCARAREIWSASDEDTPLRSLDEEFIEKHLLSCERCREAHEVLKRYADSAQEFFDEPLDDLAARKWVDQIMDREKSTRTAGSRASRRAWKPAQIVIVAGAIAATVTILFAIFLSGGVGEQEAIRNTIAVSNDMETPVSASSVIAGEITRSKGTVLLVGQTVAAGATLKEGDSIRSLEGTLSAQIGDRVTISLGNETEVKLAAVTSDRIVVNLLFGKMRSDVDPHSIGPTFEVSTREGVVIVEGTEFEVRDTDGDVSVEVYRGSVRIEEDDRSPRRVGAGEGTVLGRNGGVFVLEEPRGEPEEDRPVFTKKTRVAEQAGGQTAPITSPKVSAGDLLRQAQDLRAKRQWDWAADAYEKIVAAFPESFEAQSSRIALGFLYLERLRKPAKALRVFDSYLGSGGRALLAQEAAFGRIRALRAMGDTAAEVDSIATFLEAYPAAIQASRLRARLNSLKLQEASSVDNQSSGADDVR